MSSEWKTTQETLATATALNIHYVDIPVPPGQRAPIRFTFYWTQDARWEGQDSLVNVQDIAYA